MVRVNIAKPRNLIQVISVYLKTKPVKSEFFMFIGFKKITPLYIIVH
jgi:hypothetical protein